jgi:SH3-like domain-containing protein
MPSVNLSRLALGCAIATAAFLAGCGLGGDDKAEYAYVSAPQVSLRDRVAAVYNKVGLVNNGDKVRVLDRSQNRRFVKVRTNDGKEGWMEQRYLVGEHVFQAFARLAAENRMSAAQATAATRYPVNLHVDPARNSPKLFQLKEGAKIELLKRTSTPRSGLKKPQPKKDEEDDDEATKAEVKSAGAQPGTGDPNDPLEDWWLVRDEQKHAGWMLGRMLDVDIPLEIAQYAEGQRIVAAFVLNEVPEAEGKDKKIAQYAMLTSEPKDGMPFDFNQFRIFTWNPEKTRYETAYRERVTGELPFKVEQQRFEKEGTLPTFTVRARDKDGNVQERQYKLNGPIVRRVAPSTKVSGGAKSGK